MEDDLEKQGQPSDKLENNPETPPDEDIDITSLLEKMQKDIARVSDNTTSEKNHSALDRLEKAVDKLLGVVEKVIPGNKEETPPATPSTPDVNVPGMKWIAVRKRGGRVVKRAIPTEEKPKE